MATVTGYTADRMKQIEDETVVSGHVDEGHHLVLTRRDGEEIDAGSISRDAQIVAKDTSSVDIVVEGTGTNFDPFEVSANVKKIPASAVDSGRFDLARIPDITAKGVLEASYRGSGKARVRIDGALSDPLDWMSSYIPYGSREVRLIRAADNWLISGQTMDGIVDLPLATNWYTYNERSNDNTFNDRIKAKKLPSGLVVLTGLTRRLGTPISLELVTTLPVGYRPEYDITVPVEAEDLALALLIRSTGEVQVKGSYSNNAYLSLDGIAFWASGVGTWTDFGSGGSSFGSNFEAYPTGNYGPPGFYKDAYGFVWLRGMVRVKTATSADGTVALTLPPNYGSQSGRSQIFRVTANDVYGILQSNGTNTNIIWRPPTPGAVGDWFSLNGIVISTDDAVTNNLWHSPLMGNGWLNYESSYQTFGILRREDGLCLTRGLIRSGTLASRASNVREEFWPAGRIILPASTAVGHGRLDISSYREIESFGQGGLVPRLGGNAWYSLDSLKWVP